LRGNDHVDGDVVLLSGKDVIIEPARRAMDVVYFEPAHADQMDRRVIVVPKMKAHLD
jgi:hypothetical protein